MNFFNRIAWKLLRAQGFQLTDLVDSWGKVLCEHGQLQDIDSRERYLSKFLLQNRLARSMGLASVDLAIDVGANIGDFAASLRKSGYQGPILSVEANPALIPSLLDRSASDHDWHVVSCGVSERSGTADLFQCNDASFSSLHARSSKSRELFGELSATASTTQVELRRLDDIVHDLNLNTEGSLLLKTDTQGHDQSVVASCGELLTSVSLLLVELPIVELYERTATFSDLYDHYASLGFRANGIYPVSWDHSADSLVEVDVLFRRID